MTNLVRVTWLVSISGLMAPGPIAYAESQSDIAYEIATVWESKYVSEGRNNLADGGISTIAVDAEWQGLSVGVWYAVAQSESYDEFQVSIEYQMEFGPLETYAGYTRLEFLDDDETDNEFTAGLAFNNLINVVPAVDYTYSDEAAGGFLVISLRSEITLAQPRLVLEPYILEAIDFGYASPMHDGPNNFQLGVDFTMTLSDRISLVGSLAHSWARKDVENENLGDESWVTVGFIAEF
jgi:hypothetical protein